MQREHFRDSIRPFFLVEALRDVVQDFNARVNEQFSETFKHLNEGVAKLLVWQEQHVETISVQTSIKYSLGEEE